MSILAAPLQVSQRTAAMALFATCACWGLSFPLVRALSLSQAMAVPEATTWCLTSWGLCLRFAIATLFLLWWCRRDLSRPTGPELAQGLGLGVFTAGGMLLQCDALSYAPASTVAFLTQCYAVWIPLLAAIRQRRLPDVTSMLCVATVVVGVAILAGFDVRTLSIGRGELETLLCSLVFTGQLLWAERPAYGANRVGLVAVITFTVACLTILPVVVTTAPSLEVLAKIYDSPRQIALLVVLAVVSTGFGMLMMFRYQRFIGATAAAIIYCTEPIFTAIFAFVLPGLLSVFLSIAYPNETCTRALVIGGGLIIAANIAMQWRPKKIPIQGSASVG